MVLLHAAILETDESLRIQWVHKQRSKPDTYLNLTVDFGVDLHFIGEVEVATAAGVTWLWNEGFGTSGGLCYQPGRDGCG